MRPTFIIKHPAEPSHESYATEVKAIEAAEELVRKHGGYARVFSCVALIDAVPVVTR